MRRRKHTWRRPPRH